jgi:hypothetical protein
MGRTAAAMIGLSAWELTPTTMLPLYKERPLSNDYENLG